jgi:dihydropyrimidinase
MSILIRNGQIVTPNQVSVADLYVENERIVGIGPNLVNKADLVLDASNKLVIPGGIDVHTHLEAPVGGMVSSDDFETGTKAAAFGGTTSVIDFATQSKGERLPNVLKTWKLKAQKAVTDFGFHMIVVDMPEDRLNEIDEIVEEGVASIKVFTAYPGVLLIDDATILRIMERARKLGALVAVHAENSDAIDYMVRKALAEGRTAPIEHALTRPDSTEAEATNRVIVLAQTANSPLYVVHVSCARSLKMIEDARMSGAPIFGETCPQYLFLSIEDLKRPNFDGAKYVLTPPLREQFNQEILWRGLSRGSLQVVSTDHCPFFFETQKRAGLNDFTKIPNGGPGIENRLQLIFHHGVKKNRISISKWVDLVSTNPAKLFGLFPKKGALRVGSDADVVVWDPNVNQTISATSHHMRVDYSMYEGMPVTGNAETVISRGEVIVHHGEWLGNPGRGKYLKRERFDQNCLKKETSAGMR